MRAAGSFVGATGGHIAAGAMCGCVNSTGVVGSVDDSIFNDTDLGSDLSDSTDLSDVTGHIGCDVIHGCI